MFSPPNSPMNKIKINKDKKTILIFANIDAQELYDVLKEYWMMHKEFMMLGFPLRMEEDSFILSGGWTLENMTSYHNVSPKIKMKKPIPPIVPSQTRQYERIYVRSETVTTVESLLASCPQEINNRNIHLKFDENGIYLEILGQWPNPDYEIEKKKFKQNYKQWEKEYKFYEQIMNS